MDGPLKTDGGAVAWENANGELTVAGGCQLMDDAMTEAVAGAERQGLRVKIGLDVGGGHAGAVVLDGELEMIGDDCEGDVDLPGRGEGN